MVLAGGGDAAGAPPRPSFAAAAAFTYATQLLVAVLSLGNVLVVSWALGPSGRGQVAFLTTIAYLTASLSTVGIEQANANLAASRPELRRALAANSLVLALVFGSLAAAIVLGLVALVPSIGGDVSPSLRLLAVAAVPILVFQIALDYLVRAQYRLTRANVAWLLQPVVNIGVNGVLAVAGALTVGRAVATWVAGQALSMLVLVWSAQGAAGFGRPDAALARSSLAFGVKAHAGRVLTLGNYRLDQWIMGAVSSSRELGLYSVAVSWAEALFYLPTALTLVQRPDLVRAGREEAGDRASRVFRAAVVFTVPLAAAMVLVAPILCAVIFPAEFRGAVDDLRVLAFGGFGIVALKLLGNALTAQGRPLLATSGVLVAFVLTVSLDILLIPGHGGLGAAIASTVAYTAGGVATAVVFSRALRISPAALVPRPREIAASLGLRRAKREP